MKSIKTYFSLIFANRLVNEQDLAFFTENHIQKLTKKNISGKYDELVKNTSVLYYEYLSALKSNNKAEIARQNQTLTVDEIIVELKYCIRKIEAYIRSMFSTNELFYQELFPKGLSEYCRISKSNLDILMTRILVVLKANPDICPPKLKNGIIEFHNQYQEARDKQLIRKKSYQQSKNSKYVIKRELVIQLQKNLYTIALDHLDNPEIADDYFSQELLSTKRRKTEIIEKNTKVVSTK